MKISVTLFLSLIFIFSIAGADETSHRFHSNKPEGTHSYRVGDYVKADKNFDFDYDYDYDFDFDFNNDFSRTINIKPIHKIDRKTRHYVRYKPGILDGMDLDYHGSTLIISNDRRGDEVKITEDHNLYINGDKVELDSEQREVVGDFYEKTMHLTEQARIVGKEGARVGLKGARLGLSAIFKIIHLLSPDYDSDDMEREMDAEASLIEDQANDLGRYAEDLEDSAEEVQDLADRMCDKIPEIDRLGWF